MVGNRAQSRGMVIVIVTVVLVLVSLSLYGFVAMMQTEHKAARLQGDQLQVKLVAESGCELLGSCARMTRAQRTKLGGIADNRDMFQAIVVDGPAEDLTRSAADNGWRKGRLFIVAPPMEVTQERSFVFGVTNESARLPLAELLQWDQQQPGAAEQALLQLPGMTEMVAAAILDWIDDDDSPRPQGAEADYYAGLHPPLHPANKIPQVVEELLAVRDCPAELLIGHDRNENFSIESRERPNRRRTVAADNEDARSTMMTPSRLDGSEIPWSRLLTVYSAERNEDYWGRPRIYLNDPSLPRLHRELSRALSQQWADYVVAFRQFGPSKEDESDDGSLGQYGRPDIQLDLTRAAQYSVESPLDLIETSVSIETSAGEHVSLKSPLADVWKQDAADFLHFCDLTSVVPERVITGRINVNEASAEVLRGVPGMRPEIAERIVAARSRQDNTTLHRLRHPAWIISEGIVEMADGKELLPYLTVGGDVLRAQIVAAYDEQSPGYRVEVVVDGTSGIPQTLLWKNLNRLGRGFRLAQLMADEQKRGFAGE